MPSQRSSKTTATWSRFTRFGTTSINQDAENDAGNGRWRFPDALVDGQHRGVDRRGGPEARSACPLQASRYI